MDENREELAPQQQIEDPTAHLREMCFELRGVIEPIKARLAGLIANHPGCAVDEELSVLMSRRHEIVDNAIIAYRHLEDARMRLGKVVQALDGGKSIYPEVENSGAHNIEDYAKRRR